MKKLLIALLSISAFTACAPTPSAPSSNVVVNDSASASTLAAAYDLITKEATGMPVGDLMARKTVYVFFDPKCPHCADLWNNTRELQKDVKFIWVPAALLSRASQAEGAALLESGPNYSAAMDHHAKLVLSRQNPSVPSVKDASLAAVRKNTELVQKMSLEGVPYLFYKDPTTGQVRTAKGGLPAAVVVTSLGL